MKLDKYDRMFIAFMFVIVTFVSIGKCFAVEDIPEDYNLIPKNILISDAYVIGNNITSTANANIYYIDISNFDSVLYFNTKALKYFVTDSIDYNIGDTITSSVYIIEANNDGIYIDTSSLSEKYIVFSFYVDNVVEVYGKNYSGMTDGVTGLVDNVGFNQLWGVFENGVDFIGVVVLVAFGLFLVFLLIKKITKGKSDF